MLSTDSIILEILNNAKLEGNELLQKFKISYPDKKLAEENNCIFVAVVSSENSVTSFDSQIFKDLVEILVVTKQHDNMKAISIIKTVSTMICQLLLDNESKFPNKPVIRSINPFFDVDLILTRGQIMVQCVTEPNDFKIQSDDIKEVCEILSENTKIEYK